MPTPQTLKRINRELVNLKSELPEGVLKAGPKSETDIYEWEGSILGPPGSCYEGGIFEFHISLPPDYPFRPPKVNFKTKIYHPNISAQGWICLDILKNQWSPALNVLKVLLSISSLLTDPNPHDPLVPEIAQQYTKNRAKFERTAREWVTLHARPAPVPASEKRKDLSQPIFTEKNPSSCDQEGEEEEGEDRTEPVADVGKDSRPDSSKKRNSSRTLNEEASDNSSSSTEALNLRRSKRARKPSP